MTRIKKEKIGFVLLGITALIAMLGILTQVPVAQDVKYHNFIDARRIWSISNFWNVVSNAMFIFVGMLGLYKLSISNKLNTISEINIAYTLLFFGVFLVGIGSAYYHLTPENQTLVWDRLPMTVAFMALLSIIVSEFISIRYGKMLLLPLILSGILSVVYWHFTEVQGEGDLRFYALVQYYPMLAIPIILVCFQSRCTHAYVYWLILPVYLAAKLFEHFDAEIYNALGYISGHTLKHIVAAVAMYILLIFYEIRKCTN
jgi:hypothetical protein